MFLNVSFGRRVERKVDVSFRRSVMNGVGSTVEDLVEAATADEDRNSTLRNIM